MKNEEPDWLKKIKTPRVGVAGIVESVDREEIIIIDRKYEPLGYAFPGGFMEIGESVAMTIVRETREETGIIASPFGILSINSQPDSDPRLHVVSIFVVMTSLVSIAPVAADDALSAFYHKFDDTSLDDKFSKHYLYVLNLYRSWRKHSYKLMNVE